MADTLRIVSFSAGGRPVLELDLNTVSGSPTGYFRDRSAGFDFVPGASTVQYSKKARRYGGSRAVGETHENGSIGWTAYVRGATLAAAVQNVETLLQTISKEARGRYVEWAPEGGKSSYLEIAGPGTWIPAYNPVEFVQTNAMRVQLVFPTLPLVRWARMAVYDTFQVDSKTDYTTDGGAAADWQITLNVNPAINGQVTPVVGAALTVERRAVHVARGYDTLEGQVQMYGQTGTGTLTNYKQGVVLRRSAANTYLECYIDDDGVNSRMRIDKVLVGVRTNLATKNLVARIAVSTSYVVRARIQGSGSGNVVFDLFIGPSITALPTPLANATDSLSYSMTSPEQTTFVAGKCGWSWVPISSASVLSNFDFRPFVDKGTVLPHATSPLDPIPGTAPALTEVSITITGAASPPVFALIGWARKGGLTSGGVVPFGLSGAWTDQTDRSASWIQAADAGGYFGQVIRDTTASGAKTYVISRLVDPSVLPADEFTSGELLLEVWGRFGITNTVVTPTVVLSARSADGVAFGAERFTMEWGVAGKLIVPPSTGYQTYRLGTLLLPADPNVWRTMKIWLSLTIGSASNGSVSFDHWIFLPARSRALSPTGKPLDSAYPQFMASTSATTKTVRADLSATTTTAVSSGGVPMADHGLGGSLIEPPPGLVDWFVKVSNQVPDDPAPTAAEVVNINAAAVVYDHTPRSFMLRP